LNLRVESATKLIAQNIKQIVKKRRRLPWEPIDWIANPLGSFLAIEVASGGVLLLFTLAALIFSNSPWSHYYFTIWETPVGIQIGFLDFTRSLGEWINDALMTLFFFLVALELKRELVLGELKNPRIAALSVFAALGGDDRTCHLLLDFTIRSTWPDRLGDSYGDRHRFCHRLSGSTGISNSPKSKNIYAFVGDC
jgi:hypothetical protein